VTQVTQKWVITRQKTMFTRLAYSLFFLKHGLSPVLKKLIYTVERCKQKKAEKKSRKEKKKRKEKGSEEAKKKQEKERSEKRNKEKKEAKKEKKLEVRS